MRQVDEDDAGESADQEDDVAPAVVEAELEVPPDVRYDTPVVERHVHAHQHHGGHEVHALVQAHPSEQHED